MNDGITSFKLGLRGQPAASEWQMVERDIRLASQEGGRLHVAHASTAKTLDMVRFGRSSGVEVTDLTMMVHQPIVAKGGVGDMLVVAT